MNKIFLFISALLVLSCNAPEKKGQFTVKGQLKNAPDQKVFLEEISFNQQAPQVFDTAEIKKGVFEVKAVAPEEGLYRLRFKKMRVIFLSMINLPYNLMLMQMILPCNRPALIRLLMFHLQNSSFSSIQCTLLSSTKTGALKRLSNKTTIVLRGLLKTISIPQIPGIKIFLRNILIQPTAR